MFFLCRDVDSGAARMHSLCMAPRDTARLVMAGFMAAGSRGVCERGRVEEKCGWIEVEHKDGIASHRRLEVARICGALAACWLRTTTPAPGLRQRPRSSVVPGGRNVPHRRNALSPPVPAVGPVGREWTWLTQDAGGYGGRPARPAEGERATLSARRLVGCSLDSSIRLFFSLRSLLLLLRSSPPPSLPTFPKHTPSAQRSTMFRPQVARSARTLGRRANSTTAQNAQQKAKEVAQEAKQAADNVASKAQQAADEASVKAKQAADDIAAKAKDTFNSAKAQEYSQKANELLESGTQAVRKVTGPIGDKVGSALGCEYIGFGGEERSSKGQDARAGRQLSCSAVSRFRLNRWTPCLHWNVGENTPRSGTRLQRAHRTHPDNPSTTQRLRFLSDLHSCAGLRFGRALNEQPVMTWFAAAVVTRLSGRASMGESPAACLGKARRCVAGLSSSCNCFLRRRAERHLSSESR